MDALLKSRIEALWADALAHVGVLQRGALSRRRDLFYGLLEKHFGQDYVELASLKEAAK